MEKFGSRMEKFGFGMEKFGSRTQDKHPGFDFSIPDPGLAISRILVQDLHHRI
jgi:hypothetical protein